MDDVIDQTAESVARTEQMNDAEILGEDHPDLEDFLVGDMTFMTGELYDQGDRRNTRDGKWKGLTLPRIEWLQNDTFGLTTHPVSKSKQGPSIVPSENLDGQRKDAAVKTMHAIGIDIDSGSTLEEVKANLLEAGYFCLIYTTFNHRKTSVELKHDDVVRKLQLDGTPNRAEVQEYLRLHHKDRYDRDFISKIKIVEDRKHTAEGLRIVLETPPIDKFRVIFFLEEAVELADLGTTMNEWKEVWADAVTGVAKNICGADFDASSCDVNRLFYTPRHAKGTEWYSAVILGKPLSFDDIKPESKDKYVRERKATGDPFLVGDSSGPGDVAVYLTPSGKSLNDWHRKVKHRFEMANVIESYCQDKIRPAADKPGTVTIECPFEHEHSSTGGTATMAMNPDASSEGFWTIFCRHDACNGRHKLEFLQEMLAQGWFPEEALYDETFLIPLSDEEMNDFNVLLPSEKDAKLSAALEAGEALNRDVNDDALKAYFKPLVQAGDESTVAREIERLAKEVKHPLGIRGLQRIVKEVRSDNRADARQRGSCGEGPINIGVGFNLAFDEAIRRLRNANAASPFLFEMRDELFELRMTKGGPKLKMLNYDGLSEVIARAMRFEKTTNDVAVSVAPPTAVVKRIFHCDRTEYALPLVAIAEAPFFDGDGNLIDEDGYHVSTGIYLSMPSGFVVPQVSQTPSEEELDEAFDLFLEALGEFPFDGLNPDKIADNRSASFANTIGLACLPFMRPMIDGPTPGHLVNKPAPGTGAGLLLHALHMIWTGRKPTVMTIPKKREEIPKTIIAKLRSGATIIIFDNIPKNLDSDDLAVALSEGALDARVLGRNDAGAVDPVEVTASWIFTGNDVTMSDELLRRMTLIELDARMTNPEKREFTKSEAELKGWVKENRGRLVWACLTLIQNWIARGCQPFQSDLVKGTFSEWLAAVGGVMEAADIHHHFYGNEGKLREDSSSVGDEAISVFASVLSDYPPGYLFHVGGSDPNSIISILNCGPDGSPITISGWDYSEDDGSYTNPIRLAHSFKKFARRPHLARRVVGENFVEVEIGFDREYDTHRKVNGYRIKFRAPGGADWIMSTTDARWKELIGKAPS